MAGSRMDEVVADDDDWATRVQREVLPALMRAHLRLAAAEGSLELGERVARAKLREGAAAIDDAVDVLRELVAAGAAPIDADATDADWRQVTAGSWPSARRRASARLVRP
jgi:hypothetical protein